MNVYNVYNIDKKKHRNYPKTDQNFYIIGKVLGRGSFGKVNLCLHKLTSKLVAIKSLHKEYLEDGYTYEKLKNEISIQKTINHNNVVKLYETFTNDKFFLIAIELCSGGDLLSYVRKRRRLTESLAKIALKQVTYMFIIDIGRTQLLSFQRNCA